MDAQPLYATAAARDRIAQLIGQGGNGGGGRNVNETDFKLDVAVAKITGTETGGGVYKGVLCGGLVGNISRSSNLSLPGNLIVPSSDNLTIVYFREAGTAQHGIRTNSYALVALADVDANGRRLAYVIQANASQVFAVTVTQTGGSNGSKTSAASYTYTVKTLDGTTIGTSVALAKTRPYGLVTAGSSYGLAFYDGTTLKLWDAGEYPGSGGC